MTETGAANGPGPGGAASALSIVAVLALGLVTLSLAIETVSAISVRVGEELVHDRLGGNIVDHVIRAHHGQPIYSAPDDRWVPVVYTPLYYYLASGVMSVVGEGVFACRLTAVLLVAGSGLVALALARKLTGSWGWASLGIPLFLAGYPLCGFFYDSPRVDPLSSFVVLLATWVAVRGKGMKSAVLLGALAVAAYFSKQSTLAFSVALLGGLTIIDWRRALVSAITALSLGGTLVVIANGVSDGWFWKYCGYLTTQHDFPPDRRREIIGEDLFAVGLPLGGLLLTVPFLLAANPRREENRGTSLVVLAALATVAFSFTSHARSGATIKVLMPLGPVFAAAIPVGFAWLERRREGQGWKLGVRSLAFVIVAGFALQHHFNSSEAITPQADLERWEELKSEVEEWSEKGQVWVAPWGYFTTPMEGQGMRPNLIALEDYLGVKGNDTGLPFPEALEKQIEAQEYVAIFMPTKGGNRDLRSMIKQYYRVVEQREMVVGTNRFTMDLGTFVPRATPGGRRSR